MANTVIGSSIVIDGEIAGEEPVIVQGTVKGRIAVAEGVFVEPNAAVEADVEAESVEVAGVLTGNVTAGGRVELKADGKMVGDIKAPRILIADGALFKGNIDMDVER
ncbi:MAG: polymer-forming cytoskeletal protein [Myxococcales bacterium]|nr:polymer-forming cytoskeletal protein [Myxococcales bacterium]